MRGLREIKALMVAGLALYPLVVAFGNITAYEANFVFLQHVMSMDTTFPRNALMLFVCTFDVIFEVTPIVGELLGHLVDPA